MTDACDDARRIGEFAQRLAELRAQRVLNASRIASSLEAAIRPLGDKHLLVLVARLQTRLSERLPARPADDAG